MKRFKWQIDISKLKGAKENKATPKEIFFSFLDGGLVSMFERGLAKEALRQLFKIKDKIDADETGSVDLEDAEFKLVYDTFEKGKFGPQGAQVVNQIYDNIDEAKNK